MTDSSSWRSCPGKAGFIPHSQQHQLQVPAPGIVASPQAQRHCRRRLHRGGDRRDPLHAGLQVVPAHPPRQGSATASPLSHPSPPGFSGCHFLVKEGQSWHGNSDAGDGGMGAMERLWGCVVAAPTYAPGVSAAMCVTTSVPLSFISSHDLKRGRKEKKIMQKQTEVC